MNLHFEWDDAKDMLNAEKHGVGFDFAMHVWADPHSITITAKQTKDDMRRYIIIGRVFGECWAVVHTKPDKHTRRIISARLATAKEVSAYDRNIGRWGV